MERRTITIIGPGAVGCVLAAELTRAGAAVSLLDYRPARAAAITRDRITIEDGESVWTVPVPCEADAAALEPADLAIVLCKATGTSGAVAHALPCIGPRTAVLTLQNGLGNHEAISGLVAAERVLAGTIVMGATTLGIGRVRLSGKGPIVLGSPAGNTALAQQAAALLGAYFSPVQHEADIEAALWRKVIVNAAVNPLTALTGLLNGELLDSPELRATLAALVTEAVAVATAAGIRPFEDDAVTAVEQVCRITGRNRSSMLQDVAAGRPTEIEQICGEIARRGGELGVATPLLRAMVALVKAPKRPATS